MSEARIDGTTPPPPAPDEEYVEGYAEGYAEGLREALREMLSHVARGHTVSELRLLIQSRIARVPDDVLVKRKSLRAPPRRPAWGSILKGANPPTGDPGIPPSLDAGTSYLVREERPKRGVEIARRLARLHPRLVSVSVYPTPFGDLPPTHLLLLAPGPPQPGREASPNGFSLSEIAGRIKETTEAAGGAVVYLDALEYIATEYGVDTTIKFSNYVVGQAQHTRSTCVASVDPATWEPRNLRLLQRSFNILL